MASLALGIVGAYFFGPVGYLIGSTIGNLLFPPHGKDAQPLQNLKLQNSTFGVMIPLLYGTMRSGGNIVWQTDLTPHAQHDSGGKGGSSTITGYTYTVSCAIKVCKGPIGGFRRIWADGELIYDTSAGSAVKNDVIPAVFYLGVETASPDPTMEAVKGVGNVPAFRDDAAVVFTDWDVTRYGNRIPQLNFEVFSATGPRPWRVSTYTRLTGGTTRSGIKANGDGTTTNTIFDWTPGSVTNNLNTEIRKIDGTLVASSSIPISTYNGLGVFRASQCDNNPNILEITASSSGGGDFGSWLYLGAVVATPISGGGSSVVVDDRCFFYHDNVYAFGGNTSPFISRYPSPEGVTSATADKTYSLSATSSSKNWGGCVDEQGNIWVSDLDQHGRLQKLDLDLNLVHDYGTTGPAINSHNFVVWQGLICFPFQLVSGQWVARLQSIDSGFTFTQIGDCNIAVGDLISIGNGLVSVQDGMISLAPTPAQITLASVVTDLSVRCGRLASEVDVSTLMDIVDGYLLTQQSDGRASIDTLRNAYFFDPVESNTQVKFVKRGSQPVITIPDDDLAAAPEAGNSTALPAILTTEHAEEEMLPAVLDLRYVNASADYQDGEQRARRETTSSAMPITITVPLSMTKAKAAQVAWVNILLAWVERDSFKLSTARKYAYLEPTDVVIAHARTMRLTKETQTTGLVQEFEALAVLPSLYQSAPVGIGTGLGFTSTVAPNRQASKLLLLDIPIVNDDDAAGISTNLYYAAMAGAVGPPWPGAVLFKSSDGGTTYASVLTASGATTMGTASTILGNWTGGNVFDEQNAVTAVIGLGGGTLSSATALAVLNGANKALLGSEIVQFKNAALTAPATYLLSGFLRGRRGTEWAIGNHTAGERFVLLPANVVPATFGDLGATKQFKPVTVGTTLASATAQTFVDGGEALRPYTPVQLGGGVNAAGDVTINWVRRTRLGGAWLNLVDAPLSESAESYVIQIWNAAYTLCARVATSSTPTFVYTSAMQVADFGAQQQTIFVSVGQVGSYGLGRQANASIPGAGGSNVNPLAPVSPYGFTPPPVISGCTLPVTTSVIPWGHNIVYNGSFATGQVWDVVFTTGASVPGTGRLTLFEFGGGGPITRTGTMSTSPCGPPLPGSNSQITATTLGFYYYMQGNPYPTIYPTLAPSTTYHVSVTTTANGPMAAELFTPT